MILSIAGSFTLILQAEISNNEITPAVVALIGGPISLATLLIGVISGMALGKNIAARDAAEKDAAENVAALGKVR